MEKDHGPKRFDELQANTTEIMDTIANHFRDKHGFMVVWSEPEVESLAEKRILYVRGGDLYYAHHSEQSPRHAGRRMESFSPEDTNIALNSGVYLPGNELLAHDVITQLAIDRFDALSE